MLPPRHFFRRETRTPSRAEAPGALPLSATVSRPTMASEAECVRDAVVRFLASKPRADALQQLQAIFTCAAAKVRTVMQLLAEVRHGGLEPLSSAVSSRTVWSMPCRPRTLD